MSQIGKKIYELRTENKLTQYELSQMLKLTPKMISFYERGERNPSREVCSLLADVFDVSIDYLLDRTNDPRTPAALAIEKFGFYYPYNEREKLKEAFKRSMDEDISLSERVHLCELDLKQFFSRSIDACAFDINHVDFPTYAAMLLNQSQFKKRYGEAYPVLCEKYPPKPGIHEGRTHYKSSQDNPSQLSEDALIIARQYEMLPPESQKFITQLFSNIIKNGRES